MRALAKLLILLVFLSPLAIAALAWFMLAGAPTVTSSASLSHEDIARAKAILKANDPRYLHAGETRTITITAHDLNLAVSYLARQLAGGKAQLRLAQQSLQLQVSRRLPYLPLRNVVNIEAELLAIDGHAVIGGLRIGQVPVPGRLATQIARWLIRLYYPSLQVESMAGLVRDLRIYPDRLQLAYRWQPGLLEEARDSLLTGGDRDALRFYHDLLVGLQAQQVGRTGSLLGLLQPMFAAARQRSVDGDPVLQNTALLTVLGTWASRQDLRRLVPGDLVRPGGFRLKLQGRTDFAQHFLTTAALAARGDSNLSDAVGLFKEIADTDHGSGFSFSDIAADRSGTRFGELATRSPQHARELQARLAAGLDESDIMPPARDLPEHMNAEAFRSRFDHVGSPAYQAMMAEIDRRIDACSLYRQ
jgi:hypothetical protein